MALWDVSRHADLIKQGDEETVKFLDGHDSGDGVNREPVPDRHRDGLIVEAGQGKEGIGKTRRHGRQDTELIQWSDGV